MINYEPPQICKIPLKSCQNSIIEHNLVTIRLNVEWPDKGDNPNLVLQITNKMPQTFVEQNQSLSTMCIHATNPPPQEHPRQDTFPSFCPPQYCHQHSSAINFPNSLNSITSTPMSNIGNCNEFVSATRTELVSNIQTPSQNLTSSTIIQHPIGNISKSQLLPNIGYQNTANQQYSLHQHVFHTPCSSNMNDSQINMQMTAISPLSSTVKQSSSMTTHGDVLQTPSILNGSSLLANSSAKRIICSCTNPPKGHEDNCPVHDLHKQPPNTILTTETIYRSSNTPIIAHRTAFSSQVRSNDTLSTFPIVEPMQNSTSLPFSTPDLQIRTNLSNLTPIISQQTPISMKKPSLLNFVNHSPPQIPNVSHVIVTDPPPYPTSSPVSKQIERQQNLSPFSLLQQKQSFVRQNSLSQQDQLFNSNEFQSSMSIVHNSNSAASLQNSNNNNNIIQPMSSCSLQKQQETFIFPDTPQTNVSPLSLDTSLNGSTTNIEKSSTSKHDLDIFKQSVRSPVKLDISMSESLMATAIGSPEIDQVITEVIKGKGLISATKRSKSSDKKSKFKKKPLLSQLVWEQNGPETDCRTSLSLNQEDQDKVDTDSNANILDQSNIQTTTTLSNSSTTISGQNTVDILSEHNSTDNSKNHDQSVSNNIVKSNQTHVGTIKTPPSAKGSVSPLDISRTPTTSPTNSQSNSVNKLISCTNVPASSSSPKYSPTITTQNMYSGSSNEIFSNDSWHLDNSHHNCNLLESFTPQHEPQHLADREFHVAAIVKYLKDDNENFDPSTPEPPPSLLPSVQTPLNIDLPTTETMDKSSFVREDPPNHDEIYENFLPPFDSSSDSQTQENEVISSIPTVNSPQADSLFQEDCHMEFDKIINTNTQSKKQTSTPMNNQSNANNQVNHTVTSETPIKKSKPKPKATQVQTQIHKENSTKKSNQPLKSINQKPLKRLSKPSNKPQIQTHNQPKTPTTQSKCTRCGKQQLVDITHHEFPKQRGLVFECTACGNNSIRSNVSADERKRRLAKVQADHLTKVTCQFCQKSFHTHNDYLLHLRNDHASNKPI